MNIEEEIRYDSFKTRVLKYVLYKPRTEKEIRRKFSKFEDADIYLERTIEDLKLFEYIDDTKYAKMYIEDVLILKRLSIFEISMKLREKGINSQTIYNEITEKNEQLKQYEINNIIKILEEKDYMYYNENTEEDYKQRSKILAYLYRKGYKQENINIAKEELKYREEDEK